MRRKLLASTALPLLLVTFPQWWVEWKAAPVAHKPFPGWGDGPYDVAGPR